ncbi:MAG: hypothetical protein KJO81_06040 [Gammaproteobacteria bacterium]|nr:hypothetical protein [Gammaproteobacteria bacterium]NNC67541.1 hypothetical protein [Gammaproteobacteria bacterium]
MNTDNHNGKDEKLVSQVCDALDNSVNRIDAETSQKIIAARKSALERTPQRFSLPKLFAVAATALSIFIAVIIVKTQLNQPLVNEDTTMEMVASQDTFELYEELEFYTWLVEEDVTS